jgi:Ca-activated chloride channel family protein
MIKVMKTYKTILTSMLFIMLLLNHFSVFSQSASQKIRKGNELYKEEKFDEAEIQYRKSLEKKPDNVAGQYNLANALYRQGKYDEAGAILDSLANKISSPAQKAQLYHNLGNNLLKNKDFENSVNAYKNALKINPNDEDTRYNLSYAMEMLKQQQQQQQQKQDQKQDQNKDKDKEKEDQQKENKDENKEQKGQQEQQRDKLSREDAERMLDALNQEEKELHKEKAKKKKTGTIVIEKDW